MKNKTNHFKIYHVTESLGGGVLSCVANLANIQTSNGIDTTVVFLRRSDSPKSSDMLNHFFPDVKITEVGNSSIMNLLKLFVTIRKFENSDSTLVHLHSSWAGILGRLNALTGKKWKVFYTPHCYSFERKDISRFKRNVFRFVERILTKYSRATTFTLTAREQQLALAMRGKNVTHMPNFIDLSYPNRERRESDECIKVVCVGRLANQKRPDRFAYIAKQLKYDSRFNFSWVGSGREDYQEMLESQMVEVTGWLNKNDVRKRLVNSDIFLLLSDWEALPFTILEAFAARLPVIAWNFEGIHNLVKNGETGFICTTLDEVLTVIYSLSEDEKLRIAIAENGNKLVKRSHDLVDLKINWKNYYAI